MNYSLRSILEAAIITILLIPAGLAQSTFGSITGVVRDPSGAVVPAADVLVTNEGTALTRRATSSSAGLFSVPNLDIGTYKVRVSAKGFTS
jgi:hypothetical protein